MRFAEPLESRRLFADFSVAFTSDTIADNLKAGDKVKPAAAASFSVSKTGDLTKDQAKAKLTLDVAITGNGVTFNAKQIKITASQLAKKAKVAKAVFSTLKVAPAAGIYTITATLAGDLATGGDTNTANNTATSTFTVAAGSTTPTGPISDKPWPNSQLGNILIFTDDLGGLGGLAGQGGSFYDFNDPSKVGRWNITPAGKVNFFLDYTGEAGNEVEAKIDASVIFGGKAFKFGVAKAEAEGSIVLSKPTKTTIYFKQV